MTAFLSLFAGELQRLQKYHILTASLVVAVFWIAALQLLEAGDLSALFAMIVFLDVVSMSILMIGVTIFFEKQEGVLKSLFVAPINRTEFISAKTAGNLLISVLTVAPLYLYALLLGELRPNIPGLLGAILLVGFFHSMVGFLIIYRSRGFTDLLIGMFKYFIVFSTPVILSQLGLIQSELFSNLLFLIPTKSSAVLVEAAVGQVGLGEVLVSTAYLGVGSAVLAYFVLKRFKDFAVRESGV